MSLGKDNRQVKELLDFWFGDSKNDPDWREQHRRWYGGGQKLDNDILQRFGNLVVQALAGELSAWQQSPDACMALLILLDQFPRNIYRGSARAFAGDEQARAALALALDGGFETSLSIVERSFLYMPLEHSESLGDQQHCVALFERLLAEVPRSFKGNIRNSLDFARKHRDIILLFGRFPHRNTLLGRESTMEERRYLDEGGARFGQ